MKKIISGRKYDTEKAIEIDDFNNFGSGADSVHDFRYFHATLYRTMKSGRYFIFGYGGPMTRFAQSAGQNQWGAGWDIIPLTRQEAFEWAQVYLPPETVEAEFSDLIEDA